MTNETIEMVEPCCSAHKSCLNWGRTDANVDMPVRFSSSDDGSKFNMHYADGSVLTVALDAYGLGVTWSAAE